jgi:sulfur transfer complex TusBCD TusB component (DsrH family)
MDKVEFFATVHRIQTDDEGEATFILKISAMYAARVTDFHARNLKQLLSVALVTVPDKKYIPIEENITTGEIKDKEGG